MNKVENNDTTCWIKSKNLQLLIRSIISSEHKIASDTKKSFIKTKLNFENCKNCLEATQLENKINHP